MTAEPHVRVRALMTTLATAGHQLNMGDGFAAITTLRLAGAQLGALRAQLDRQFDQGPAHPKRRKAKRKARERK